MRTAFALALLLAAAGAFAAESTSNLALTSKDLVLTVKELSVTGKDRDLVVEDMIRVKEAPKEIRIELPADILFDFDKSDIRTEAAVALDEAAKLIRDGAKGAVRIEGHTDSKGLAAHNEKLSVARAQSVKVWLVEKAGLVRVKFALKGFGATRPAVPNTKADGSDDPGGRHLNRRVEIIFARK